MLRRVKNLYHLLSAFFSVLYFRYPTKKLKVIGVTGTDGKTTTVNLIYSILEEAGRPVAMISSVSDTGFHVTTPGPWPLQKLLRKMVNQGVEYVVLEATSHGLDQHRLFGCNFQIGVITNVTHEHLDYHLTYENYLAAKAKLFRGVRVAVLNRDDKSYIFLKSKINPPAGGQKSKIISYGIRSQADFTPESFQFKTKLPGEYNQYNCLAAIGVAKSLGVSDEVIRKAVADFPGVIGRMEEIDEGQDFKVFVDFAHTPNALEQVLKTLRNSQLTTRNSQQRKLVVIFGCAGLRDREKRPLMGEIAAKYADFIVLTADDPRTEDVNQIADEIAQGCFTGRAKEIDHTTYYTPHTAYHYFVRIPDRQEAINFAIGKLARKGDIVVICGKGHEKSMCFGRTEYPWSDQEAVRKVLKERLN
jgi:UDP-N-acetylmuramoyl-L-alanyl-D-glutamate--2,6-diaminopimelate ligase